MIYLDGLPNLLSNLNMSLFEQVLFILEFTHL